MTLEKAKLFFVTLGAALSAKLGLLATPVYILLFLGLMDYCTGLIAAPMRGEQRSSYRGLRGIVKKLCTLFLIVLAAIVDWMLLYCAETLDFSLPFHFVIASATAVWLICNELISILENISDIGVDLPPFLKKATLFIRQNAHQKGDDQTP